MQAEQSLDSLQSEAGQDAPGAEVAVAQNEIALLESGPEALIESIFAGGIRTIGALQQGAGFQGEDAYKTQQWETALGPLILGLRVSLAVFGGVGRVDASAIHHLEGWQGWQTQLQGISAAVVCQTAADVGQFVQRPAGARLAVGAGVFSQGFGLGLLLVVGADLADGLTTGGAGIEDLVQKSQEREPGRVEALPAVGVAGVRSQEGRINPLGTQALQVVQRLAAQRPGGVLE